MPLYEYKCVDCDERFEVEQSMSAPTLKKIKGQDHTHNVKKVFSPVGISFKGSGFYKNDSAGKKKAASKTSSSDAKETKTESTPTSTSTSTSTESSASKKAPDKASTA